MRGIAFPTVALVLSLQTTVHAADARPRVPDQLLAVPAGPGVVRSLALSGARVEERLGNGWFLVRARGEHVRDMQTMGLGARLVAKDANRWFHERGVASWQRNRFSAWEEIEAELAHLAAAYPAILALETVGTSVNGRNILAIKVSDNPQQDELEPAVRIMGVHHGDEAMSAEVCLRTLRMFASGYGLDTRITELVDHLEIWIIPVVNPDGYVAIQRDNANDVDLNRNYGFMWGSDWMPGVSPYSEPEVWAMHQLAQREGFTLSLSFHTTAAYVNFPWNHTSRATPDEPTMLDLFSEYATLSGYQAVAGYDWYQTTGDADDHLMGTLGGLQATIETDDMDAELVWLSNHEAILTFLTHGLSTLHGQVTDASGSLLEATIWFDHGAWPVHSRPGRGDFHKFLLPGSYTVRIEANGHAPANYTVNVVAGQATQLDVTLDKAPGVYAQRIISVDFWEGHDTEAPGTPEATTVLSAPDGIGFPVAPAGSVVVDLGPLPFPFLQDALWIHTVPGVPARYEVLLSNAPRGPWTSLGFFLDDALIHVPPLVAKDARYVKIATEDAVLMLDAVEATEAILPPRDAGVPDGAAEDSGETRDAGTTDAGGADPDGAAEQDGGFEGDAGIWDAAVLDSGMPDATTTDASTWDSGTADAHVVDAGGPDAALADASISDAHVVDSGIPDAATSDANTVDSSVPDGAVGDASVVDGGIPDGAARDASTVDSGIPDAARHDASKPDSAVADSGLPDAWVMDAASRDAALLVDASSPVFNDAANPDATLDKTDPQPDHPDDPTCGCHAVPGDGFPTGWWMLVWVLLMLRLRRFHRPCSTPG